MLDLAIAIDINRKMESVVETNSGEILVAPDWPQDCETKVVSFEKNSRTCRIVNLDTLIGDIGEALALIDRAKFLRRKKPDWYLRLQECSCDNKT